MQTTLFVLFFLNLAAAMMLNMLFNKFLKIKPGNRKEEEEEEKRKNKLGILMTIFAAVTHPAFYPA